MRVHLADFVETGASALTRAPPQGSRLSGSGYRGGGGGSGRRSRIRRAAGARKLVKTLRAGFSGGADPEGRRRQILSLRPSRQASLPPKPTPPPSGDVSCRRGGSLVSALPWCCSPTSSTPGTDIILIFQKSPPYRAFRRRLIQRISAASHSRSSACDRPPACSRSCFPP